MTPEEMNAQILVVPFVEMEPHVQRGAVVVIDESLDLATVGIMLAQDDKAGVEDLIARQLLTKASPLEFEAWRREKRFFRILIIQPFVVAQHFVALAPEQAN